MYPSGRETRGLLKPIDDLLRCGICFDHFDIAMIIPQCSHTYCSLCIRKFLSYKTQCPICCVTVTGPELRNNRLLDDLVKSFLSVRELLCSDLRSPQPTPETMPKPKPSSEKPAGVPRGRPGPAQPVTAMDKFLAGLPPSNLADSPSAAPAVRLLGECQPIGETAPPESVRPPGESAASHAESSPSTSGSAAKVRCPICSVEIPEANINRHLDNCLAREDKIESLRSTNVKRKLLPKVVYNLLSDRDLKKKLKECGLSSQGSKAQLTKRHQAFVQMYNAQCDSLHPRSAHEIVKEIESNEKRQAQLEKQASENVLKFSKNQSEEEIDEIHTKYRKKHKREFQHLIDELQIRQSEGNGKSKEEESKNNECLLTIGETSEECEVLDLTVDQTPPCEIDLPDELVSSSSLPEQEAPETQPTAFSMILHSPTTPTREAGILSTRKRLRQNLLKKIDCQRKRVKK